MRRILASLVLCGALVAACSGSASSPSAPPVTPAPTIASSAAAPSAAPTPATTPSVGAVVTPRPTPEPTPTAKPKAAVNGKKLVAEVEKLGEFYPIWKAVFDDKAGFLTVYVTNATTSAGAKLVACEAVDPIATKYGVEFAIFYANGDTAASGVCTV